ncbi:hypothetical protein [Proteus phage J3S]
MDALFKAELEVSRLKSDNELLEHKIKTIIAFENESKHRLISQINKMKNDNVALLKFITVDLLIIKSMSPKDNMIRDYLDNLIVKISKNIEQ